MKLLLLTAAVSMSLASAAQADWRSERTSTGANGVTSTANTSVTRDGDTRTTRTDVTRSNGTGYTREAVQTWDPVTKSWSRSVTGETAQGKSWTNEGGGSCANGTCSSQSTYSGPKGAQIQSESETTFGNGSGKRTYRWFSNKGRSGEGTRIWRRVK